MCFTTSEEATYAINGMNGKQIGSKMLVVRLKETKKELKKQRAQQRRARGVNHFILSMFIAVFVCVLITALYILLLEKKTSFKLKNYQKALLFAHNGN